MCRLAVRGMKVILLWAIFSGTIGCESDARKALSSEISEGEELAMQYCALCHQLPDPAALPKNIWDESVLPNMAQRLGLDMQNQGRPGNFAEPLVELPEISIEQWEKITKYYWHNAPEELKGIKREISYRENGIFRFETVSIDEADNGQVIMIRQDPSDLNIYVADHNSKLYRYSPTFELISQILLPGPAVDIEFRDEGEMIITCVGILTPNDEPAGEIVWFKPGEGLVTLIDSLVRPVNTVMSDINNDGLADLVVSEFGNNYGSLSWYENRGNTYKRRELRNMPGSLKATVVDHDGDGLPDIMSMFGQGIEGLFLFRNKGNDEFEEQQLLSFPPEWGSSYFELADINRDGYMDIIAVNGDNADYSPVLKPYHGLRIYLWNEGGFEESYFYPMYGASYCKVGDYNNDSATDIAVISYFANFEGNPIQDVVVLENTSSESLSFTDHYFKGTDIGRWLVLENADVDADNDLDIVIGSFTRLQVPVRAVQDNWNRSGVSLGLLRNDQE